jgi:hypothetical protein
MPLPAVPSALRCPWLRWTRLSVIIIVCLLLSTGVASAQTKRILLVGDSWTAQAWNGGAFDTALQNKGLSEYASHGGPTTIGGSTAAQWATQPYLDLITQELAAHPSLDIVHLSMGGNDLLPLPDPIAALPGVMADIQGVVDHILSQRPDARITIWPYDYIPSGTPSQSGLLAQAMIDLAALTPGFYTWNTLGVLHHVFGFPPNFAAGTRPLPGGFPGYTPLVGGDLGFGGDPANFQDPIHPTLAAYTALAQHGIDEFYAAWLVGDPPIEPVPGFDAMGAALLCLGLMLSGAGLAAGSRPSPSTAG